MSPVVHVLILGRAFCGQKGVPSEWPKGERWIAFNDPKVNELATCAQCRNRYAEWSGDSESRALRALTSVLSSEDAESKRRSC